MKHVKILCVLLVICLLAGCTPAANPDPTEPSVPESSSVPTQTDAPPTSGPVLVPELNLEPVTPSDITVLSSRPFSSTPSVAVLDQRTAAFLTTEYDKTLGRTVSNLMVLDLYTDTVLGETGFDYAVTLPVQSWLPGYLPVYDQASDTWIVLNKKLETVHTFSCEEGGGVFTPDLSAYYYISAQRLCKLDPYTGESAVVETDLSLPLEAITDYHVEDNILLLQVHTQYYLTNLCVGAVDLDTGEVLMLNTDVQSGCFSFDGIFLEQSQLVGTADLISTDWANESPVLFGSMILRNDVDDCAVIPRSDYAFKLHYDARNAYKIASFALYRCGGTPGVCELYDLTDGIDPDKVVSLPGGNLLAVAYGRRSTDVVLICPEQLTFSESAAPEAHTVELIDATLEENYAEQFAPVEVPEELAQARELADKLEQRYDITILLSNQCDSIIEQCGFELQPTDKAGLKQEAKLLLSALADLEECLVMYPEGFFSQFRNAANERGILVLLVENIAVDTADDNVDVLGVTYDMGDWYPIAVDITTRNLPATYCHEIWHAIENKITGEEPSLLNDVTWAKLNPDGFTYKGAVAGYYYDTEHTFIGGNSGRSSYFVDAYGKTNAHEDRARLMEYIMTSTSYAESMMKAPVLHQKMEIMITAIRAVFDTEGWSDVYWERFHS